MSRTCFFGIEVVKVQEMIRYQEMTVVPLAPSVVDGLINLRGQIVIAINTRRCLGLPRAASGTLPMKIVIKSEDDSVSLLVDEIGDVIGVPLAAHAPVPDNMPQEQKDMIECVCVLGGGGGEHGWSGEADAGAQHCAGAGERMPVAPGGSRRLCGISSLKDFLRLATVLPEFV